MTFLIQQTLLYAVPLMIVALAGVFAERSGIINLALEGIMIFGAFIGVLFVRSVQEMDVFMTAYNEYITDVIISVIVYLSAFSLVIRMMLTGKNKAGQANANAEPDDKKDDETKKGGEQA